MLSTSSTTSDTSEVSLKAKQSMMGYHDADHDVLLGPQKNTETSCQISFVRVWCSSSDGWQPRAAVTEEAIQTKHEPLGGCQ